jgi:hypothetical protein
MEQRALEAKQAQRRVEFAQALAEHIRINGVKQEEEKLFEAAQSDKYVCVMLTLTLVFLLVLFAALHT